MLYRDMRDFPNALGMTRMFSVPELNGAIYRLTHTRLPAPCRYVHEPSVPSPFSCHLLAVISSSLTFHPRPAEEWLVETKQSGAVSIPGKPLHRCPLEEMPIAVTHARLACETNTDGLRNNHRCGQVDGKSAEKCALVIERACVLRETIYISETRWVLSLHLFLPRYLNCRQTRRQRSASRLPDLRARHP